MFNHNLIKSSLTRGLVIAAVSFPAAAQAVPISEAHLVGPPRLAATQRQQIDQLTGNVSALFASEGGWHIGGSLTPHAAASAQGGFQWGDAGIGAAGAMVLLGAGLLGAGMARRHRVRRTVIG